jgi:hypothetical protein
VALFLIHHEVYPHPESRGLKSLFTLKMEICSSETLVLKEPHSIIISQKTEFFKQELCSAYSVYNESYLKSSESADSMLHA